MNVTMIVPTGIGAEIGGHAGDAGEHRLSGLLPQPDDLEEELLAGRGPAAGTVDGNDHTLDGVFVANIIEHRRDLEGGPVVDDGEWDIDDPNLGLARIGVEENGRANGQADRDQQDGGNVPSPDETPQGC
ncbi:MAG: DUF3326 domain-containing protein [Chloroflexi bacterium]|nr:DUF3326 domain-containing protein [Chloroflexota bacterium]